MERVLYARTEQLSGRLFDMPPRGVTVVRTIGMEAIVAAGYEFNRFQSNAYVVVRRPGGLLVTAHTLYAGTAANCDTSGCLATFFDADSTSVSYGDYKKEVDLLAYLRAQVGAYDALVKVTESGRLSSDHDPLVSITAAAQLDRLVNFHTQDTELAVVANLVRPQPEVV